MNLTETIRKYLGWCPNQRALKATMAGQPDWQTGDAPGDRGALPHSDPGWYNQYHNQLLIMAVNMTLATTAVFFLFDNPADLTWKGIIIGISIGISASLVTLWDSWKRYDRIEAGEFITVNETKKQRNLRYIGILILSLVVIGLIAFWVINDKVFFILAVMLGVCGVTWVSYLTVVVWERRHHKVVISEKKSMYTVDVGDK